MLRVLKDKFNSTHNLLIKLKNVIINNIQGIRCKDDRWSVLDRLPDEIILNIITLFVDDFRTLYALMNVSARMAYLTANMLKHNMFRRLSITITVDQEGRSRASTQFLFNSYDEITNSIVFNALNPAKRRYYSYKESPTIRCVTSTYKVDIEDSTVIPFMPVKVKYDYDKIICTQDYTYKNKGLPYSILQPYGYMNNAVNIDTHNRRIKQFQKDGMYTLQISKLAISCNKPLWKLQYKIHYEDNIQEYYFTPIKITLQLDYILQSFIKSR
ncbi:hypothetical protein BDB01DRAFT_808647 [Pilobolus umbonatus]|nr:hypothetical protein BDB01DRAFT_808647 [Pilobolus umbonatus]